MALSIEELREHVNTIDQEITKLYEERMNLVMEIAEYKKEHRLAIFDQKREEEVIEKNSQKIKNSFLKPYYKQFIQFLMDQGKSIQQHLIMNSDD